MQLNVHACELIVQRVDARQSTSMQFHAVAATPFQVFTIKHARYATPQVVPLLATVVHASTHHSIISTMPFPT